MVGYVVIYFGNLDVRESAIIKFWRLLKKHEMGLFFFAEFFTTDSGYQGTVFFHKKYKVFLSEFEALKYFSY